MARRVERSQRASAPTLPSNNRPPDSQLLRPGTPFSVLQSNTTTLHQWRNHLQGSQPPLPGIPLSVPQQNYNTLHQRGKQMTSRDQGYFASLGFPRLTRHTFRRPKFYEDQRFKKPDARVTEELQKLKTLIKASANQRTLDPRRDVKENKKWTVPLPLRVPAGTVNPLTRDLRPTTLQPATRKRVASSSVTTLGKVKRSKSMSTGFEESVDFNQMSVRVPATSKKHSTRDASEKLKEDHTVPGPSSADSSADQRRQVIPPHIQGSLHPSLSSQGDLGISTSPQDAQGLSLSTQDVLELNKCFQGSMEPSTSVQESQRLPSCAASKTIPVSSSRRSFKSLSPTLHVSNLSNSLPKHVGQDTSGQGDLQQVPSDKEGSKPSSSKDKFSDFSLFPNVSRPTTSPQESLTHLTAAKAGQRDNSSQKENQICPPFPPNHPMQSAFSKVSLRPDPDDQGHFKTSPLNQQGFQSPLPLKNGLRSSLTVQRGLNGTKIPQGRLTPLIPAQAETKISTSKLEAQGPLPLSVGTLESSTYKQDVVETPESTRGTLVPSAHTQNEVAPSPSFPGALIPSQPVRGALGLSSSTEECQRHVLKSDLPQKRRLNHSPAMKGEPEHAHSSRRLKGAPSKQRVFRKSRTDQELFKYPLPAKRPLLTFHQIPKSQGCAKSLPGSHASSVLVHCAKMIQPALPPQGTLGHSDSVGETVKLSTYTSEMLGFPKPVQDSLITTLSHKGTVGQDTSTKGVQVTVPSLAVARGCDTATKDVLGYNSSVQKDINPVLCEQGAVGHDMHTKESVASCTSKEGRSLYSTCVQESIGPPQIVQEAVGTDDCT